MAENMTVKHKVISGFLSFLICLFQISFLSEDKCEIISKCIF